MANNKSVKPYPFKELKKGPHDTISKIQFERWQAILFSQIRKDANWYNLIGKEWGRKTVKDRGLTKPQWGQSVAQQCTYIDNCLSHISHYGPTHLSREMIRDATSLKHIWEAISDWAQIKTTGKSHLTYYDARRSYDPETISQQDFFHKLLHTKKTAS